MQFTEDKSDNLFMGYKITWKITRLADVAP